GILEAQLIDPDRALPPRSGRDHQLDRGSRLRGTTARRAPGKLDLAAFDCEGLPVHGEVERLLAVAPDIQAGRVHQLELEDIARGGSPHVQTEGVALRERQGKRFACDHETTAAPKIEVQAHRFGSLPLSLGDVQLRLSGGDRVPTGHILKVIQNVAIHVRTPLWFAWEPA